MQRKRKRNVNGMVVNEARPVCTTQLRKHLFKVKLLPKRAYVHGQLYISKIHQRKNKKARNLPDPVFL